MLNCIEIHRTCDFPAGVGVWTPIPPLDPHMKDELLVHGLVIFAFAGWEADFRSQRIEFSEAQSNRVHSGL